MGWIALSSQKDTDPSPFANKQALSDVDLDRVAYWGAKTYFPNGVLVPGDPNAVPPVADSIRLPTGAEVFTAITDDVYADIKRKTEALFLAEAEAKARESVAPISLTPTP
jgi:hypothetical protein